MIAVRPGRDGGPAHWRLISRTDSSWARSPSVRTAMAWCVPLSTLSSNVFRTVRLDSWKSLLCAQSTVAQPPRLLAVRPAQEANISQAGSPATYCPLGFTSAA